MKRKHAGVLVLLLACAAAWLAIASSGPPEVVPAGAPPEEFSAERALADVERLAASPRPQGTDEHAAARDYLLGRLRDLGLEPQVQTAVGVAHWGEALGTVHNIVARLPGAAGGDRPAVLAAAHYDSVFAGPGASDDAAGVAALLETVRALGEGPELDNDVIILLTDGEEAGLLGAEAFAHSHPWMDDVGLVLNFEARGTRGPSLMFQTGPSNAWAVEQLDRAVPHPNAASYSYEVYRRMPNDSDFSVFLERDLPGLNFAYIHGAVGYHTAMDSLDHLDPASLQHHGSSALALVRHFGGVDLSAVPETGDAIYFNPLGSTFVRYPASWALPIALLLALVALALVGLAVARRGLGAGSVLGGLVLLLLGAIATGGLALAAALAVLPRFYNFRIWGDASGVSVVVAGLALVALGVALALFRLWRRWLSPEALAAGGLLLWTLFTLLVSAVAPGASYLFAVPLAAQLLAVAVARRGSGPTGGAAAEAPPAADRRVSAATVAVAALAVVVTAFVWAPALALIVVALFGPAALLVGLVLALVLALLGLQTGWVASISPRWLVPAAAVVLGLGIVAAAKLSFAYGPDSPRFSTLLYAVDTDEGTARWAAFAEQPDPWAARVLPEDERERVPFADFLGFERDLTVAPAPPSDAPAPAVELVERTAAEDGWRYRFRVASPSGAERTRVLLDAVAPIDELVVAGRTMEVGDGASERHFVYYAPPAEGFEVEVETSGPGALEVAVVDQLYGLPDAAPAADDPTVMPAPIWDTHSTLVRKSFTLDAPPEEVALGAPSEPVATDADAAAVAPAGAR